MSATITVKKRKDAAGRQIHVVRVAWASASSGDVAEITHEDHIPRVCALVNVACFGDSGTMASRQPDVHIAATGLSSVPAGSRTLYQATSTVVATQIADTNLGPAGVVVSLGGSESVYARLQPDTGSDNGATMELSFTPVVGG